ncbi:BTB/POZ domain-containing protein 7 isoform X2 [Bacillus rossius redtenbacheri]|uniref:BTB/POZ domain-containing protein 7 isoform X2 n=1 Tax=Bacillus rossius redtenbacheri TaxID=93214 RepID=UPI002FDD6645
MNLFRALIPCALQRSCWAEDERMTRRMGASVSSPSVDLQGQFGSNGVRYSVGYQHSGMLLSHTGEQLPVVVRERKKKATGFATLRKKLIRRRRSSKTCDHGRVLREFVSDWSAAEVAALLEEYEALAALKDLSVQAELARPPAATYKQDLSTLYDFKHCTDCDLVFRGVCFPVHRAILSARCPYFRDLLAGCPGYGARICLELRTPGVDVQMFSALLRYLYTGDICTHEGGVDRGLLRRLGEEFGTPGPLEHDLRYLLETGDYADAALVFTSDGGDYQRPDSGSSEYGFRPKLELPCHKAILSARSPFFRNLIQRRTRTGEDHTERALHIPTRIVLDECVIPKRYARVLLHAVYLDTVDLSLILRGSGCGSTAGSLGEVQQLTHTGRARPSALEEAMELYQIGRFLELDILSQGCEDLVVEGLSLESLPQVLRWGAQPHGSAWVQRQAARFLREEFQAVAQSPVLHQLERAHLAAALRSHFLQASELEVLQAVLRWGEQELVRRMEDREPNLLSHTAHSVTRKGVKKRDLSDVELREILSELLPLVRMDHVLPPSSEVLVQAIRRGLVSTPPSHMLGDEREGPAARRANAWVRSGRSDGRLFVTPRLFAPYCEEVKAQLEGGGARDGDLARLRMARYVRDIPDTLYMVEDKPRPPPTAGVDVLAAALPVPDSATMAAMLKREQKLRQAPSVQRAVSLPLSSRHDINRQVRLRVVREFNLPDAVADLLESAACYCSSQEDEDADMGMDDDDSPSPSPPAKVLGPGPLPHHFGRNMTFPRGLGPAGCRRRELPAVVTEGDSYRMHTEVSCSPLSAMHQTYIIWRAARAATATCRTSCPTSRWPPPRSASCSCRSTSWSWTWATATRTSTGRPRRSSTGTWGPAPRRPTCTAAPTTPAPRASSSPPPLPPLPAPRCFGRQIASLPSRILTLWANCKPVTGI